LLKQNDLLIFRHFHDQFEQMPGDMLTDQLLEQNELLIFGHIMDQFEKTCRNVEASQLGIGFHHANFPWLRA
jgi:hypothetical protein